MLRLISIVIVFVVAVPALIQVGYACGDKFLMVGRGAKFQRAFASVHPGNVLIFAKPSTDAKAAIRDPQLYKALRQAGHTVNVIEDRALFEQALKTLSVDIVLVDVAEAPALNGLVAASSTHPEPMYVAFPSAAAKLAEKQFMCPLKSSDGSMKYLEKIENVMKSRRKKA